MVSLGSMSEISDNKLPRKLKSGPSVGFGTLRLALSTLFSSGGPHLAQKKSACILQYIYDAAYKRLQSQVVKGRKYSGIVSTPTYAPRGRKKRCKRMASLYKHMGNTVSRGHILSESEDQNSLQSDC